MDPERKQSISVSPRYKMKWRIKDGPVRKKCWVALSPASIALSEAVEKIESVLIGRNRDVFNGEDTSPACSYDPTMFGRSVHDAQPTVIFSSSSEICRKNAKRILENEDILVDPRGVGLDYYCTGPQFFAGVMDINVATESNTKGQLSANQSESSSMSSKPSVTSASRKQQQPALLLLKRPLNGELAMVGGSRCTIGGIIVVGDKIYGLTVAHVFETEGF